MDHDSKSSKREETQMKDIKVEISVTISADMEKGDGPHISKFVIDDAGVRFTDEFEEMMWHEELSLINTGVRLHKHLNDHKDHIMREKKGLTTE